MSRRWPLPLLAWLAFLPPAGADMFTSKEGGFQIDFPVAPKPQNQEQPTPLGLVVSNIFIGDQGGVRYGVILSESPFTPTGEAAVEYLDGMLEGMTKKAGGRVASATSGIFQGFLTRDVRFEGAQGPHGLSVILARFIIVDSRCYQILTVFPSDQVDENTYRRFRESFKLQTAISPKKDSMGKYAKIRPVGAIFRVAFPSEPSSSEKRSDSNGLKMTIKLHELRFGEAGGYLVNTVSFPETVRLTNKQAAFDGVKNRIITGTDDLQGEQPLKLQGWDGMEFRFGSKDRKNAGIMRCFLVDNRAVNIVVVDKPEKINNPEHKAFLDSLEFAYSSDARKVAATPAGPKSLRGQPATFAPKAGGFSVAMPGKAEERTETLKYKGETLSQAVAEVVDAPGGFRAGTFEIPAKFRNPDPSEALNEARDAMVARVGGKVLIERKSQVLRSPAREIKVETSDGLVLTARLIFNRRRVYEISAARTKANPEADAVAAFLNSFKLTGR